MSRVWEPDPSWRPLTAGPGSGGLWLATRDGRSWVIKRLERPDEDQSWRSRPDHAGYWRREAEVARNPEFVDGPGLVPPPSGPVEEDEHGLTIWTEEAVGE